MSPEAPHWGVGGPPRVAEAPHWPPHRRTASASVSIVHRKVACFVTPFKKRNPVHPGPPRAPSLDGAPPRYAATYAPRKLRCRHESGRKGA